MSCHSRECCVTSSCVPFRVTHMSVVWLAKSQLLLRRGYRRVRAIWIAAFESILSSRQKGIIVFWEIGQKLWHFVKQNWEINYLLSAWKAKKYLGSFLGTFYFFRPGNLRVDLSVWPFLLLHRILRLQYSWDFFFNLFKKIIDQVLRKATVKPVFCLLVNEGKWIPWPSL